jgi:HD-GYP domain-containing protein (c-di-GMP phosphodiesterase class II)
LALLGAAVVATELFQVESDDESLDPADAMSFSFSSGVHIAAILTIGPVAAMLAAAFGVIVVDGLRKARWQRLAFNASVFALATAAAGVTYGLSGGTPGQLDLPGDLLPILALLAVYRIVNLAPIACMIALNAGTRLWPVIRDSARVESATAAAEAGLGVATAYFALQNAWFLLALAPLVLAVFQGHARLKTLRRETLHALETFANVVDERDPHTYRHSERVADRVLGLAEALHLPAAQTARLRLAARLHDLGKIAVDGEILGKPGSLDPAQWSAMRRHARLSARLLRRFRFATDEARLVEYHHERYDGGGYYGIATERIPLGAHFLIVADSYDAMTSDRPYRNALSPVEALARIEEAAGTQFHPVIAKAFVALERGQDPLAVLEPHEREQLGRLSLRSARPPRLTTFRRLDHATAIALGGLVAALVSIGAGEPIVAGVCFALSIVGMALRGGNRVRARRFEQSLRGALEQPLARDAHFHGLVGRLAAVSGLNWAGVVSWSGDDLNGTLELEARHGESGPTDTALVSWLIRETESRGDLLVAEGAELGDTGLYVALPLRREDPSTAYLVLAFEHAFARFVELALRGCRDELSRALLDPEPPPSVSQPRRLAAVS